ncbi:MAG: hypothetical protein AAFP80_13645 [Pseudomonadota bacterium]
MAFDWTRAIEINRVALLGVVAMLFSILSRGQDNGSVVLAACRRRFLLRLLVPAEAAARRLIFIVARVMQLSVLPRRQTSGALPDFKAFSRTAASPRFKLVDPRQRLDWSAFSPEPTAAELGVPTPAHIDLYALVSCDDVFRRAKALEAALNDLSKSARRMVREEAKRLMADPGPARVPPIRMGPPPGFRRVQSYAVDDILKECAGLARDIESLPP